VTFGILSITVCDEYTLCWNQWVQSIKGHLILLCSTVSGMAKVSHQRDPV